MTFIPEGTFERRQRVALRIAHQHSGNQAYVKEVIAEAVPIGVNSFFLQNSPFYGILEEASLLNFTRNNIGGVETGQTTSVVFSDAAVFFNEVDYVNGILTVPGDYKIDYQNLRVNTFSVTNGGIVNYAWAPINNFIDVLADDVYDLTNPHNVKIGELGHFFALEDFTSVNDGLTLEFNTANKYVSGSLMVYSKGRVLMRNHRFGFVEVDDNTFRLYAPILAGDAFQVFYFLAN